MTGLSFPYITAATAIFVAVFQMSLMLWVALGRGQYKTGLGDGGHPALLTRIRIHGNLAENAPLFLILLALTETSGQWPKIVPWYAAAFVAARLLHACGLMISSGASLLRLLGVLGTVAATLGLAWHLAVSLSRDTHWMAVLPHLG
jgi:uncharacterized protein